MSITETIVHGIAHKLGCRVIEALTINVIEQNGHHLYHVSYGEHRLPAHIAAAAKVLADHCANHNCTVLLTDSEGGEHD